MGYCIDRIYFGGEALCIHNATTGRESTMPHVTPRAGLRKEVVVVGAGPGGWKRHGLPASAVIESSFLKPPTIRVVKSNSPPH
jgi:hypothetical protein